MSGVVWADGWFPHILYLSVFISMCMYFRSYLDSNAIYGVHPKKKHFARRIGSAVHDTSFSSITQLVDNQNVGVAY